MILTDREIQAAIQNKHIVIDPPPALDAYSSTTVDLTLSSSIRTWKTLAVGIEQIICPAMMATGTSMPLEISLRFKKWA